jgi:hypothetical protein
MLSERGRRIDRCIGVMNQMHAPHDRCLMHQAVHQIGSAVKGEQCHDEGSGATDANYLEQTGAAFSEVRSAECEREVEQNAERQGDYKQPQVCRKTSVYLPRLLAQGHERFDDARNGENAQDGH